ncbi:hypothetical protein [Vampirovibrio sp.]|uniref:hypothetical protein n=1 Tax=Vampirovibrio sp. TaxID=2717857 RepID=UPI0035932981
MFQLKPTPLKQHRGNTMAEYALIASMVCLVSLTTLLAFSGAFSNQVGNLKVSMKANTMAANEQATELAAIKALGNQNSVSRQNLNADAFSAQNDVGNTLTTGANGKILGLNAMAGDNLASALPHISREDKNLVKDVANTAHQIARFQEMLEQLSEYSNGDMDKFRNSVVVVDGNRMTAFELASTLGDTGLSAKLAKMKQQILSSGMGNAVKGKVSSISEEIRHDANTTSDTTNEVLSENTNPKKVSDVTDSKETDQKASMICKSTGGKDTGKNCGTP